MTSGRTNAEHGPRVLPASNKTRAGETGITLTTPTRKRTAVVHADERSRVRAMQGRGLRFGVVITLQSSRARAGHESSDEIRAAPL